MRKTLLMGCPINRMRSAGMRARWAGIRWVALSIILGAANGCAWMKHQPKPLPASGPPRFFVIDYGRDTSWKQFGGGMEKRSFVTEYLRIGETMTTWGEAFLVINSPRSPAHSVVYEDTRREYLQKCPSSPWTELARDSLTITYEWRAEGCTARLARHELGRFYQTPAATMHLVYLWRRPGALPDSVRTQWLTNLRASGDRELR